MKIRNKKISINIISQLLKLAFSFLKSENEKFAKRILSDDKFSAVRIYVFIEKTAQNGLQRFLAGVVIGISISIFEND
ncbi:MAG TPA: hypothetical protein ACHBZ9_00465 [Arsenophonus nasoniae]|uniref:hypothetical protein n=1 Tax=Arsenophonus nasoniae TaxID=638 RepID=UPI003879BD25